MNFSKKSLATERGQGLVEYTLIVLFVVLVFWVAVKGTNLDEALGSTWGKIQDCVGSPFTCQFLVVSSNTLNQRVRSSLTLTN